MSSASYVNGIDRSVARIDAYRAARKAVEKTVTPKRYNKSGRKPLPPYGQQLVEAKRRREHVNCYICAGPNAWNRHRIRVDRVVLPPDAEPDDFDWSIFSGLEPTVIGDDADPTRLSRLTWLLLSAGARLVCVIFEEDGVTTAAHFRP